MKPMTIFNVWAINKCYYWRSQWWLIKQRLISLLNKTISIQCVQLDHVSYHQCIKCVKSMPIYYAATSLYNVATIGVTWGWIKEWIQVTKSQNVLSICLGIQVLTQCQPIELLDVKTLQVWARKRVWRQPYINFVAVTTSVTSSFINESKERKRAQRSPNSLINVTKSSIPIKWER